MIHKQLLAKVDNEENDIAYHICFKKLGDAMDVGKSTKEKEDESHTEEAISGRALVPLHEITFSTQNRPKLLSQEDPFDEDDWTHYAKMNLLVTNPTRVSKAINEKSCNALLLKW